jgi:hypothetical protein
VSADGRWHSRVFGMAIAGEFKTQAFDLAAEAGAGDHVELEIVSTREFDRAWTPSDPVRKGTAELDDGTEFITIDLDPELGYRMWCEQAGRYLIDPSGDRVVCAPGRLPMWGWQRFLIGQVLPLVAAVRGYEMLHASAVCLDGRAIAFLGDSEAGKTSLATNMLLQGAEFMADDALAIGPGDDHVLAHPGPPIAAVRHAEVQRLSLASRKSLGTRLQSNPKEVLFRVQRYARTVPLGAMYFIDRKSPDRDVKFEPITDPLLLISSTFNFVHRPPQGLANLLDMSARIAASAGVFHVKSPPEMGAAALSAEIRRHAETLA